MTACSSGDGGRPLARPPQPSVVNARWWSVQPPCLTDGGEGHRSFLMTMLLQLIGGGVANCSSSYVLIALVSFVFVPWVAYTVALPWSILILRVPKCRWRVRSLLAISSPRLQLAGTITVSARGYCPSLCARRMLLLVPAIPLMVPDRCSLHRRWWLD